jgi:hypothetical protein
LSNDACERHPLDVTRLKKSPTSCASASTDFFDQLVEKAGATPDSEGRQVFFSILYVSSSEELLGVLVDHIDGISFEPRSRKGLEYGPIKI